MKLSFSKWHGLGNDFILVYWIKGEETKFDLEQLAFKMCERNFGIGADGLILLLPSESADFKMRAFNADGAEADMCGNAVRCAARYLYENKLTDKTKIKFETLAGLIETELILENGKITCVKADMGQPRLTRGEMFLNGNAAEKIINYPLTLDLGEDKETYYITCVSMGNPHCVIFTDDLDSFPVEIIGPLIENHPMFPKKTNVEFLQIISKNIIKMRVWERGVGVTKACGTGACAALAAACLNSYANKEATVKLAGGDLKISWQDDNHIYMQGPATIVFEGEFFV